MKAGEMRGKKKIKKRVWIFLNKNKNMISLKNESK